MRFRPALVAFAALLPLAACDSSAPRSDGDLFGLVGADAAVVLRADRTAIASLDASLVGTVDLPDAVPLSRIDQVLVASDTSGQSRIAAVDVSGRADDLLGGFVSLGRAHRGAPLYRVAADGSVVAARDGDLIVAPTEALVTAALDRLAGAAPRLADDPVAARHYARISASPVGLMAADLTSLGAGFEGVGDGLSFVPIGRVAFGGQLTGTTSLDGTLWMAPRAGTSALTLAPLLSTAVTLLRAQAGTDPAVATFLGSLRFTADGEDVRTPVTLPLGLLVGGRAVPVRD